MATLIRAGLVTELRLMEDTGFATPAAAETALDGIPGANSDPANWTDFVTGIIQTNVGAGTSFDLSDEALAMAAGFDKNCLQRHALNIQVFDLNAYLMLNQAMRFNVEAAVQIRWKDGTKSTWSGVRFTFAPVLNPLPNAAKLWAHNSPTEATDPPAAGWQDLGTVFIDEGANTAANTLTDGAGLPLYSSVSYEQIFGVDYALWGVHEGAGEALEQGVTNSIAIELTDGTYLRLNNVFTEVRRGNVVGQDVVRHTRIRVVNGDANLENILANVPGQGALHNAVTAGDYPGSYAPVNGTPPTVADCLFGYDFTGAASGQDETNFYVES